MNKLVAALCLSVLLLTACSSNPYHESDFVGKSSSEIIEEFGEFDCTEMPVSPDGLYRNTRCGYTIKESQPGFLGRIEETLFFIHFDENGIAYECSEGYRPGG